MGLIDFILDNLFLIIIAVGFLSSILAKKNQEEKQRQAERSTASQTASSQPRQPERIERYENRDVKNADAPVLESSKIKEMNEEMQELKRQQEQRSRLEKEDKASPIYSGDPYARKTATPYARKSDTPYERENETPYARENSTPYGLGRRSPKSIFNGQGLRNESIQGMMWAEVFGQPKAKQPYRPRSYRRIK